MAGAQLGNTDLEDANLKSGNLESAILEQADLEGANLADAALAHLRFPVRGLIKGTPAALPEHWKLVDGYLFGPEDDLYGVDLKASTWKEST